MKFLDFFKNRGFFKSSVNSRLYLVLRSKFLLAFILIALIPSAVFGIVTYQKSKDAFKRDATTITTQNSELVAAGMNEYFTGIKTFVNELLLNAEFQNLLKQQLSDSKISSQQSNFKIADTALTHSMSGFGASKFKLNLSGIYILSNNQITTFLNQKNNNLSISEKFYKDKLKIAQGMKDSTAITGTELRFYDNGRYESVLSAISVIKDTKTGEFSQLLLFDFTYDNFSNLINSLQIKNYSNCKMYLTDQNNTIMFCENEGLLTTKLEYASNENSFMPFSNSEGMDLINPQTYENTKTFGSETWKLIYFIPSEDVYQGIYSSKSLAVVFFVCSFIVFIFSFIISSVLLKPLNSLSSLLSADENLSYSSPPSLEANTEEKSSSISSMDGLIQKVYRTQLEHKDAQLKALQNQISPHFLYNTLESIRGAALYHGIDSIAEMSRRLSLFFRYSISESVLDTIQDEILNLENYISIQNFRHDDKFEFSYDISERILSCKILRLTLQPLVENSIKHGLEMKMGKGKIRINILDFEKAIRIELYDDGVGMPSEKIIELNRKLSEDSVKKENASNIYPIQTNVGTGIGVQNVNSRIALYFGSHYGIKYKEVQTGTCVEITLPVIL